MSTPIKDHFEFKHIPYRKNGSLFLPGSEVTSLHSGWADMHFHNYNREKYLLFVNIYTTFQHRRTQVYADDETVEFTFMLSNQIENQLGGFKPVNLQKTLFNITYLSSVDSITNFEANQLYCTFDIHLKESFLNELLLLFPEILNPFMNHVKKKESWRLFPVYLPASQFMNDIVRAIFHSLEKGIENFVVIDKDVEALIAHAITYNTNEHTKRLDIERLRLANEIYFRIIEDPFSLPKIKDLCKYYGINATTMRIIFKETFHRSIRETWVKFKMDSALYQIAKFKEKKIEEISAELGYTSLSNFSKAFKKAHHLSPSSFRKDPEGMDLFYEHDF